MSEQYDTLIQKIGELTATVKEHRADQATLDWDSVKGTVEIRSRSINRVVGQPLWEGLDRAFGGPNKTLDTEKGLC